MIRGVNNVKSGFLAVSLVLAALSFSAYSPAANAENGSRAGATSMLQSKDAVMIIRFNQKYVYFENALKKVVDRVSAVKPNALYEIQSLVPNDSSDANSRQYLDNLRSVIASLNHLGISKDRISVRTDVTDIVQSQEVNIFIR